MKTLLIPTLTLALACLPALAQEIAAPTPPTPPPPPGAGKPNEAPSFTRTGNAPDWREEADNWRRAKLKSEATPVLAKTVQIPSGATINEAVTQLNQMLQDQGADPLNVVVSPELEKADMPAITLRNVSAGDVLNVITKVTGLNVEPVLSDSGKVAAWIITPPGAASVMSGMAFGMMGRAAGTLGSGGAGGIPGTEDSTQNAAGETAPILPPPLGLQPAGQPPMATTPAAGNNYSGFFTGKGGMGSGSSAGGGVTWVDPAAGAPPPAQVNRVLGVARIYADVTNENERVEKEAMLVKMLREMTEVQKLKCDVRLYGELHVLVVKGSPEAVELVEQTISALKENAGAKKGEGGSKFSSGLGIKN